MPDPQRLPSWLVIDLSVAQDDLCNFCTHGVSTRREKKEGRTETREEEGEPTKMGETGTITTTATSTFPSQNTRRFLGFIDANGRECQGPTWRPAMVITQNKNNIFHLAPRPFTSNQWYPLFHHCFPVFDAFKLLDLGHGRKNYDGN